ncbi:uncharacterized protein LOC133832325 [Humulus lupulus]|uniref:uncharacterized protein LOC133832325 n=1 Tax=Humulus lupulus TaxID=3486 RepID=UPI002B402248|nr:uncharacterized protein LOC133832325 [Humulus lupulus]
MKISFGNITLKVNNFHVTKQPHDDDECYQTFLIDTFIPEEIQLQSNSDDLDELLSFSESSDFDESINEISYYKDSQNGRTKCWQSRFEELPSEREKSKPFVEEVPIVKLSQLPEGLKHVFLGDGDTFPVIISSKHDPSQEIKLLQNLKSTLGWMIADIKGIIPLICSHRINLEDGAIPRRDPQRRLNPSMKEVVKNEVLKLLDADIIYPVHDRKWVSPTQVVPKKSVVTVVENEQGALVPTRTVTGWRMCIDYRKLNSATRKDHFPLPFIDQILERVAGHPFYCFVDGYSATFQRCMMSIFSDMVEKCMEVFMDDLTVFGNSFDACLLNLEAVLTRCIEKGLVLNWEKCHFMVSSGIVLRHIISERGIEVDQSKIDLISNFPTPKTVKDSPDWNLPFEIMYDASNFVVGAVLGQRREGKPFVVYYASRALNSAQMNYSTTGKEMFPVVFALDNFKGVQNVVADHLSQLEFSDSANGPPIRDDFPDEQLLVVTKLPWYAHIANCLVTGELPSEWSSQDRLKFLVEVHNFYWDDPYLLKYCLDQIMQRCLLDDEVSSVLKFFHNDACGDFMGPFPSSSGYIYILLVVDYVSKWVEVVPCQTNDNETITKLLKENILSRFSTPRAIISDQGIHFRNKSFEALMRKYGVLHKVVNSYHPQTNGQAELANREIKQILEKTAYWAVKALNFDLSAAGINRKLQLSKIEELRNDAYDNSRICKEKNERQFQLSPHGYCHLPGVLFPYPFPYVCVLTLRSLSDFRLGW